MSDLRDQLEAIADASPAPTGPARDREIQQAITRGLATPAREGRRAWPWIALATSLAVAAVIALVVVRTGERDAGSGSQVAAVDAGVVAIDADPIALAPDAAPDAAPDLVVEATPTTRYQRDGGRLRLEEGELVVGGADPVEVTTPEARLVGAGARFVVGRYANETKIRVELGEVLVTPAAGEAITLRAGESWPAESPLIVDAGVPAPRDAGTAKVERDAGVRVPVLQFDATIIRKTIRAGNVGDAREMIEAGRSTYASSKRALAELGILAAEADLAERKTKSAIGKYLDVVRDHAATPQAEQALFAAAQLAIDRPDAGYKAQALLQDYLDTYPKGQFAKDAARLLETLKK